MEKKKNFPKYNLIIGAIGLIWVSLYFVLEITVPEHYQIYVFDIFKGIISPVILIIVITIHFILKVTNKDINFLILINTSLIFNSFPKESFPNMILNKIFFLLNGVILPIYFFLINYKMIKSKGIKFTDEYTEQYLAVFFFILLLITFYYQL
ncbi:hypothetical protein [Desulfitibacter alkalitolerans]|uniref:hypothetical protein n=1 Tax=Desulfitibacter alkalitolerans TaxID=264641 RepID=UPI000481777F|nr:hypothetical protein [Desulfitibacter alkalitolerans]